MDDKNSTSRRGACDRCRGQKLRCVGSARPVLNPTSRLLRNEIPCDRCRRAKVDCYSVRSAPRRAQTVTINATPPASERSSLSYISRPSSASHPTSLRPPSVTASGPMPTAQQDGLWFPGDHQNDRLSSIPPVPVEWITYLHEDQMRTDENLDIGTPPLVDTANSNLYHDTVPVNQQSVLGLMNPAAPDDWSSDDTGMEAYTTSSMEPPPEPALVHSRRPTGGSQSRQLYSMTQAGSPTGSSIHDLSKLHETLLRDKPCHEHALAQLPDTLQPASDQRSIGQTLNNCQRFISILKRIRYSQSQVDNDNADGDALYRGQLSGGNNNSNTVATHPTTSTPPLRLPTLFSILFCYTSILTSYEEIFLSILETVTRPTSTIPPTLSGLRIYGFELDGHNSLQLECLLNVSNRLLEKAEWLLFGSTAAQGEDGGMIRDALASGLVDLLLDEGGTVKNGPADDDGSEKREIRVKGLIREIRAALNEIDI